MKRDDFIPPKIEEKIVCISDDYILAAQISACFNDKDTYFVVLEPPRSLHKYWSNEFIKLNNLLAKIRPKIILFANVKKEMMSLIKKQLKLKKEKYFYLKKASQIKNLSKIYKTNFKGILECPPEREKITHALLEAKRKKYQLIINPNVEYEIKSYNEKNIVMSDSSSDMLPVILANYAFSINTGLKLFDYKSPHSSRETYNIFGDTRGNNKRSKKAKEIIEDIKSTFNTTLKDINKYEFITFFTDDFYYGYYIPEIPTTHIYNKLLPSYFIANAIVEPFIPVQSAVLVDPGFFANSETNYISNLLKEKKVFVKELRDNKFTNLELDNHIQCFPYDFLFICSHGDFPTGVRFKIKFFDKAGCDHIITIDTLDSFDLTDKGIGKDRLINVKTFFEFVDLDGEPWYSKKYKKGSSKTIVEDFLNIDRKNWDVLEKKDSIMKFCNIIRTKDGPYIPMIHGISDPISSPFIFNNACVSSYTMATNFIFAGSSFYVGTVKPVDNLDAIKTAQYFFKKSIVENKSLSISLWEAQNERKVLQEDKIYICVGCHFQKLLFLQDEDNTSKLKKRLIADIFLRKQSLSRINLDQSVIDKHSDAMKFLIKEYKKL